MRGLHKLVMKGDILYPAVSDTPAWVCNHFQYSLKMRLRG